MKDWFPLTDYDFYAYMSGGLILVAAIDYSLTGGVLVSRQSWNVPSATFWAVICYLVGQLSAGLSASFIEHLIARRVFRSPVSILTGIHRPRLRERVVAIIGGAREYSPLPKSARDAVMERAAPALSGRQNSNADAEAVFHAAFAIARSSADAVSRMDRFLNLYGFCRNVAFASLVATPLLLINARETHRPQAAWLAIGALVLAIGMFARFMKFYAAYSKEALREFGKVSA